jgi:hypothetical protein
MSSVARSFWWLFPALLCGLLLSAQAASARQVNAASASYADVLSAYNAASPGDTVSIPPGTATWTSTLDIRKRIQLVGAGVGVTVLQCSGNIIDLSGASDGSRITGLEIGSGVQSISLTGGVEELRIDHCRFVGVTTAIQSNGHNTGVVDHNIFLNCKGELLKIYGDNNAAATFPFPMGTRDALFFEDNTFTVATQTLSHIITSNSGARYVVRHNVLNDSKLGAGWRDTIDAHGYCEIAGRGSFTWEVYENTFNFPDEDVGRIFHFRGGQGIVFNNTVNGSASWPLVVTDYRGQAGCDTCYSGCGVYPTGYPLKDQINHTYIWNNTVGGSPMHIESNSPDFVKLGRDYFDTAPAGYTPYTYPHPLTTQEPATSSTIPLPPTNVRAQ